MRRLLFDIEVSLGKFYAYRCGYNINLLPHQIIEEPKIICIAYKFLGDKKTYCLDWGRARCDKEMLKKFLKIAETAGEIIGHNSDRFDIKWLRTRCFFHNLPIMPEFTSIDTYKEAKKGFYFQSNGLDYINKYGGGKGKEKTEWDLWVSCNEGKRGALAEMKKYCVSDVHRLEEVYERLRPYMKAKTSIAEYKSDCPYCASENIKLNAYKTSVAGIKYAQMKCVECGQFHKVTATSYSKAIELKKSIKK